MPLSYSWLPHVRLSGILFLFSSAIVVIADLLLRISPDNFTIFRIFVFSNLIQVGLAALGIFNLYRVLRRTRAGFFYDIAMVVGFLTLVIWGISHAIVIVWPLPIVDQIRLFETKQFAPQAGLQQITFGLFLFSLVWLGISMSMSNMLWRTGRFVAVLSIIMLGAMLLGNSISPIFSTVLLIPMGIGLIFRRVRPNATSPHVGALPS